MPSTLSGTINLPVEIALIDKSILGFTFDDLSRKDSMALDPFPRTVINVPHAILKTLDSLVSAKDDRELLG